MSHSSTPETRPTATPNVVVANPAVRKIMGYLIGAAAVVVPTLVVLDGATDALDWSAWTIPAMAVTSFLAGIFQVSVSSPNVPHA